MITTLLLDVDGVLVSSSPDFLDEMDREYVWRDGIRAFFDELTHHPDSAATLIGEGDVLRLIEEILPTHVQGLTARDFVDRWFTDSIVVNQGLIELIGRVGIKNIYLASNQDRLRGTYIRELFSPEPWLSGALMSFELGYAKPDARYFTAALAQIEAWPEQCLFVDDRTANVAAAGGLGMTGVHYRDLAQFTSELQEMGLLD